MFFVNHVVSTLTNEAQLQLFQLKRSGVGRGVSGGGRALVPPAWFQNVEILGNFIFFRQVCVKILGYLILIKPSQFQ